MATQISPPPIVEVTNLAVSYRTRKAVVQAVRDISFAIHPGETFGLVGESGCGKSTVAYALVNFLGRNGKISSGDVRFHGKSLVGRSEADLTALRGSSIAMVYQDPMQALNPSMKIGTQLTETLVAHQSIQQHQADQRCIEMLKRVYMPDPQLVMQRYPHQLSGGQQQRVVIAMALLNRPSLLIMDEPTTALDVTVEAAVLDLVEELRGDTNMSILFITHNLGVIARIADRVGVMYAGEMVECAPVEKIFSQPMHPYTRGLIRCLPKLGRSKETSVLYPIPGKVSSQANIPSGCLFEQRCPHARPACRVNHPAQTEFGESHFASCLFAAEISTQVRSDGKEETLLSLPFAASPEEKADQILSVNQLKTYYTQADFSISRLLGLRPKQYIKAVDEISFCLPKGKTLGIVGESGCGKSTLAKTIVGLEKRTSGKIGFLNVDLVAPLTKRSITTIKELQMVFQNPDSVLNPSFSIGYQISRPILRFSTVPKAQVRAEVLRLLEAVGLDEHYYERLPRQLSGGEKQRIGIARAIATRPALILCDEPVSALDVSVQAAILNLLIEIQNNLHTSMIFISHDLSVIRYLSDYVGVMYLGKMVEFGPAEAVYSPPYHPYTQALLSAVPMPNPHLARQQVRLRGEVPSALNPPSGCHFHPRCPLRHQLAPQGGQICAKAEPPWQDFGNGHRINCHIPAKELVALSPIVSSNEKENP